MRRSRKIEAYQDSTGGTRELVDGMDQKQPGDPAKAARAILAALDAGETLLRLPLGGDAMEGIRDKLGSVGAELDRPPALARDTGLDEARA